jgi:hypothetical protein
VGDLADDNEPVSCLVVPAGVVVHRSTAVSDAVGSPMRFLSNAELIIDLIPDAATAGTLAQAALERGLMVTSMSPIGKGDQFQLSVRTAQGKAAPEGTAWAEETLQAFMALITRAKGEDASHV